MAYEIPGFSFTLVAAADQSASQFRFINVDSNGKGVTPSVAGQRVVGVRNNKPKSGEAATIVASGISIVESGAAVTVGGDVMTDTSGRAIDATGATAIVAGIALEAASAAGQFIAVLLTGGSKSVVGA
jgi:hypothetical protein